LASLALRFLSTSFACEVIVMTFLRLFRRRLRGGYTVTNAVRHAWRLTFRGY
jgi:hypothetical protein